MAVSSFETGYALPAAINLVPDEAVEDSPSYVCTWSYQDWAASRISAKTGETYTRRDVLNDEVLFGEEGWANTFLVDSPGRITNIFPSLREYLCPFCIKDAFAGKYVMQKIIVKHRLIPVRRFARFMAADNGIYIGKALIHDNDVFFHNKEHDVFFMSRTTVT